MEYRIPFIRPAYQRFFQAHREEIIGAIVSCLERGELTLRQETWELEQKLAKQFGTKYAVTCGSGTDALFLACKALGIGPGDEVITVSHTFVASLQAIVHCGATPVLVDVRDDELMDVSEIEAKITPRTKAIMPIQYTGKTCDMAAIVDIAERHGLKIIEDACQAFGAEWVMDGVEWSSFGPKTGSFGDVGCLSFNTAKLLGAYGDGGAIVTDDPEIAREVALLRNHWNLSQLSVNKQDFPQPETVEWAWKSRLDNIQAAVLLVKLKYLKENLSRRDAIAKRHLSELAGIVALPTTQDGQVWQEFHIRVQDRPTFVEKMASHGIETLVRDTTPYHKLPNISKAFGGIPLPVTEAMSREIVRLPLHEWLTDDEVAMVIDAVRASV